MSKYLITSRTDWTEQLLHDIYDHIEDVAVNDLKLDVYPNQIEIISAEQMIDAYASVAMPINYSHWSFGKTFLQKWNKYQNGNESLAYEVVINSNPCISYLMEENNAITQALVMAHACFGHNFVFKNNYLFKDGTSAGSILDYMTFAKHYIRECEEKYGEEEVERVLDAAHALANHGVDKSARKHKKKLNEEDKQKENAKKENEKQQHLDIILQTTSIARPEKEEDEVDLDTLNDEENLLYFLYKYAPNMPQWKREILRIVYKIHQYFYPQGQCQTLNEGMATFTHWYIMDQLEQRGVISPDAQIAWLHLHSGVTFQPDMNSKRFRYTPGKFNPYAMGFDMLKEVRRVCTEPTKEDAEWFPDLVGKDWRTEIKHAVSDYRDDSFIEQFLTPKMIRELKMMQVKIHGTTGTVADISDELGYRNLRRNLASQYNRIAYIPEIVAHQARMRGDRTLTLLYRPYKHRSLHRPSALKTLAYVKELWGYDVEMITAEQDEPHIQNVLFKT